MKRLLTYMAITIALAAVLVAFGTTDSVPPNYYVARYSYREGISTVNAAHLIKARDLPEAKRVMNLIMKKFHHTIDREVTNNPTIEQLDFESAWSMQDFK